MTIRILYPIHFCCWRGRQQRHFVVSQAQMPLLASSPTITAGLASAPRFGGLGVQYADNH